MKKHIMLVDDDLSVLRLLKAALEKNGYHTESCHSGEEALKELETCQIDVIILDIILPGMDGLEVLKRIKNHSLYKQIPIIMLTSKASEVETVLGLEMGADDYLSKPVRYHELLSRLKKIFQRIDALHQNELSALSIHGLEIDFSSRTLHINKALIQLTYMEYELLVLLARNPGKVFTRSHLLDLLWYDGQFNETRTVDVHVRRIRRKLEESGLNPNIIETIRSVGYRLSEHS